MATRSHFSLLALRRSDRRASSLLRVLPPEYTVLGILVPTYVAMDGVYAHMLHARVLVGLPDALAQLAFMVLAFPAAALITLRFANASIRQKPFREAIRISWGEVRLKYLSAARIADFIMIGTMIAVLMASFTAFKLMIPDIHPISWDERISVWTKSLYLGHHAWQLLQPVVGYPIVTRLLDFCYFALWFPITWGVFAWQAWRAPSHERSRYIVTYVLCWVVLGTVLATLFSSAGPQFYGRVVNGPDPYAGLSRYLDDVSRHGALTTVAVREFLWNAYTRHQPAFGAGIAAMPSMHVAMAELSAIVGRRTSRALGVALTSFSIVTLIGSVALGAHYSIDGFFSILFVHALWRVCGMFFSPKRAMNPSELITL